MSTTAMSEFLEAHEIIKQALAEMGLSTETLDHHASAIIARLAQANYVIQKV